MMGNKVGMLLTWNGRGSDCSKLFHVTEVSHRGRLDMPPGISIKYFCDPKNVISNYRRCLLHESKRGVSIPVGYGLATVYHTAFG
jgi:hypothetical protein